MYITCIDTGTNKRFLERRLSETGYPSDMKGDTVKCFRREAACHRSPGFLSPDSVGSSSHQSSSVCLWAVPGLLAHWWDPSNWKCSRWLKHGELSGCFELELEKKWLWASGWSRRGYLASRYGGLTINLIRRILKSRFVKRKQKNRQGQTPTHLWYTGNI